ncbi:uncharacterized protein LOC125440637 [Sphaerodactylus townsendi]|uniref:uncharacterized protein LOC125440637 n=1 Tax=Sphaerodactylus townsendi TaxID=933632 RepID=UPI0020263683|nr:uncharacterized protein LOC125440637 [Sphaerodactylus townsendi]
MARQSSSSSFPGDSSSELGGDVERENAVEFNFRQASRRKKPEQPAPLNASITFRDGSCVLSLPPEIEGLFSLCPSPTPAAIPGSVLAQIKPIVWDTDNIVHAPNVPPVLVKLKPNAIPIRQQQYSLAHKVRLGLQPVIDRLLRLGILEECESAFSTPIIGVPKKDGTYRMVHDLRKVNEVTEDLHPVVPNYYTLLTLLPSSHAYFSCLDLKDAFFSVALAPECRYIFAFEWTFPDNRKIQIHWCSLPQGFKNSPTLFGTALERRLRDWTPPDGVHLLQYVDDLLLSADTEEVCLAATVALLNFLADEGFRVSRSKAQIAQQEVIYLGCLLKKGTRSLTSDRKEAIAKINLPDTRKELRKFLGMAGYTRNWIPGYAAMTKPLYEMLTVLALLSKQLDLVARGWPACLRAVAAACLLVEDALKFTLGGKMTVFVPHAVLPVLEQKGSLWLTQQRMSKYQSILIDSPGVKCATSNRLNPATLLPTDDGPLEHDCIVTMDITYAARADLQDMPLENPQLEVWTDGSSQMIEGKRMTGCAVVTQTTTLEALPLPSQMSAQAAELMALLRALHIAHELSVNIYTDSRYAFGVVHAYAELWHQRGLLTAAGDQIKHASLILQILAAVHLPQQVAVIHCKGHAAGDSLIAKGNRRADVAARLVARTRIPVLYHPDHWELHENQEPWECYNSNVYGYLVNEWGEPIMKMKEGFDMICPLIPIIHDLDPIYTAQENTFAEKEGLYKNSNGWWETPQGPLKISPFEVLFGRPYPLSKPDTFDTGIVGDVLTVQYLSRLANSVSQLHRDLLEIRPAGLTAPLHPFEPGDWVFLKSWKKEPLTPVWKGPYQILLTTYSSAKVQGVKAWVHFSRLKQAAPPPVTQAREKAVGRPEVWSSELGPNLHLRFRRHQSSCPESVVPVGPVVPSDSATCCSFCL